jgi:hypothetical protein
VFVTGFEASAVNKGQHVDAPVITKPYDPEEHRVECYRESLR